MLSFLSGIFSLPVLIAVVVVVVLIFVLSRLVKKPAAVNTVLQILKSAEGIIKLFMPDKWEGVYDALLAAAEAVTDGSLNHDEAIAVANKIFDAAVKAANITLSDTEKAVIVQVIGFVVGIIVSDKVAAKVAIKSRKVEIACLKAKGLRKK
jgi:hypothetical protein